METYGTQGNVVEIKDQKIELEGITLLHMNEIRKWTQFLSILGFVGVGLVIFAGVIMLVTTSLRSTMAFDQLSVIGPFLGIFYIVFGAIYFVPVYYMYQFSVNAKKSLMQLGSGGSANEMMARAIGYLKSHFRFVGIFTIVILALYLVVIIGVVIALALR
jgi:hypothetical protein